MSKSTKPIVVEEPVIDPRVLDSARQHLFEPKSVETFPCRICAEPGASEQSEGLCWVCRRLKISAWRDTEVQIPMSR